MFRGIDRWGALESTALSPQAVNLILKKRARLAGLDAAELSAHGLQSGYLSETARRGIPLVEAMQQSQHRSVQQAASYDNEVERQRGTSGAGHLRGAVSGDTGVGDLGMSELAEKLCVAQAGSRRGRTLP